MVEDIIELATAPGTSFGNCVQKAAPISQILWASALGRARSWGRLLSPLGSRRQFPHKRLGPNVPQFIKRVYGSQIRSLFCLNRIY
jgi:hypothetical protein